MSLPFSISKNIGLVIVDIQYDFLENGPLPVQKSSGILPHVIKLIHKVKAEGGYIIATQDWHPPNHKSFASNHENKKPFVDSVELIYHGVPSQQTLWPDHCLQGSEGAKIVSSLLPYIDDTVHKGTNPYIDSYSGFADNEYHSFTPLAKKLYSKNIDTLLIVGLATDYCVKYTCIDAVKFGFKTYLVSDATEAVVSKDKLKTFEELEGRGVQIVTTAECIQTHHTK
ncbi:unnamed protein product [Cunninghamella blakesleeana]